MTTRTKQPGANARPGRATRAVVYPAFNQTGPNMPAGDTRPIYLYLRLSKYHKDKADAIERQRLDLTRKLATEGGSDRPLLERPVRDHRCRGRAGV